MENGPVLIGPAVAEVLNQVLEAQQEEELRILLLEMDNEAHVQCRLHELRGSPRECLVRILEERDRIKEELRSRFEQQARQNRQA